MRKTVESLEQEIERLQKELEGSRLPWRVISSDVEIKPNEVWHNIELTQDASITCIHANGEKNFIYGPCSFGQLEIR